MMDRSDYIFIGRFLVVLWIAAVLGWLGFTAFSPKWYVFWLVYVPAVALLKPTPLIEERPHGIFVKTSDIHSWSLAANGGGLDYIPTGEIKLSTTNMGVLIEVQKRLTERRRR